MKITIQIETHIYAEDRLIDWVFGDTTGCGLFSPDDFGALWNFQDAWLEIEYNDLSTIGDIQKDIINSVICDIYDDEDQFYFNEYQTRFYFINNGTRFSVEDKNASFQNLLKKYLDPDETGIIHVVFLARMDAGQICREDNLRYYMHSHEGNRHNEPHVHVKDLNTNESATISIVNFSVLDGHLSSRSRKKAIKRIANNQEEFVNFWNTKTDGLCVDINKYYQLIDY